MDGFPEILASSHWYVVRQSCRTLGELVRSLITMWRGLIGRQRSLDGLHITEEGITLTIPCGKFCWSWSTWHLCLTCLHGASVDHKFEAYMPSKNIHALWIWHYVDFKKCSEHLGKVLSTFTDLLCCDPSHFWLELSAICSNSASTWMELVRCVAD